MASELIEELRRNPRLAEELASLLLPHIASRIAVPLNVATKDDFEELKKTMSDIDEKVGKLEERIGELGKGVKGIEARVSDIETRIAGIEARDAGIEARITNIEARVTGIETEVTNVETRVTNIEARVTNIEARMATKDDIRAIEARMATKDDIRAIEDRMATKDDIRAVMVRIDGLGARWGLVTEEAFRKGVEALLKEAGYTVEIWRRFDDKGFVYGRPSEVELDVVVRNGKAFIVEITSTLKRGDLPIIARKVDFYKEVTGGFVESVYVICATIDDKKPGQVMEWARELGITIIKPGEALG